MKKLLFIKGNRNKISEAQIKSLHQKIKSIGYLKSLPIQYIDMQSAKDKIGNYKLYQISVTRKNKSLSTPPVISDFTLEETIVDEAEYANYDGILIDGQHRQIVSMIHPFISVEFAYQSVQLEKDIDLLQYIALLNSGNPWGYPDFESSGLLTNNESIDHILRSKPKNLKLSIILPLYTLGIKDLSPKKIVNMQQGVIQSQDKNILISKENLDHGDKLMEVFNNHIFLSFSNVSGRFTKGIKLFYAEINNNFEALISVLNRIDKKSWEKYFVPEIGRSLEPRGYKDALIKLKNDLDNNQNVEIKD